MNIFLKRIFLIVTVFTRKTKLILLSKSVLITGASGFIGINLVKFFSSKGYHVYALVRNNGLDITIQSNKISIIKADLKDGEGLKRALNNNFFDIIIHTAALVNPERKENLLIDMVQNNFLGTMNLLEALNDIPYGLFINTGTCEEYGDSIAPFFEDQRESPVSPYSLSKVCSTYLCEYFAKQYDKPIITVRPFLTYGPGQISKRLIPTLIHSALLNKEILLTSGEQTRDFIYIDDVVHAYYLLSLKCENLHIPGIINIGSGKPVKIRHIIRIISNYFPDNKFRLGAISYRSGENFKFFASIQNIQKYIDWKPRISLDEGIFKTINWWEKNPQIWKK